MNWKINYWTLITFIILGGMIYSCTDNGSSILPDMKKQISDIDTNVKKILEQRPNEIDCKNIKLDTISQATVEKRTTAFFNKMTDIKDALEGAKSPITLPVNFAAKNGYFKLPKCELTQMWDKMPTNNKEVYVYLTLENVDKSKEQMFSLVISEKSDFSGKKQALAFDFIRPCPPYGNCQ